MGAGWVMGGFSFFAVQSVFGVFFGVHVLVKVLVAWDASRRYAEDRGSGALEMLLCCPVEETAIWRGWLASLKRTYLAPLATLVALELGILLVGLSSDDWWRESPAWSVMF